MRILTVLVLPLMLVGCGKAISMHEMYIQSGLDLSVFDLDEQQLEYLSRQLAQPYYCAAAAVMFLFAMLLWVYGVRYLLSVVLCILMYIVLQVGTLSYLCHVVKRK